jgi:hypothetical protein
VERRVDPVPQVRCPRRSVRVRSRSRRVTRTSTLTCGSAPSRPLAASGRAATGVRERTSTDSTARASSPSAHGRGHRGVRRRARGRPRSRGRAGPPASPTPARRGRGPQLRGDPGSVARSSRMSSMPFASITSRSRPSPIASPDVTAGSSPARRSTSGWVSPHSPTSTQLPSSARTSTCRPAVVYGCSAVRSATDGLAAPPRRPWRSGRRARPRPSGADPATEAPDVELVRFADVVAVHDVAAVDEPRDRQQQVRLAGVELAGRDPCVQPRHGRGRVRPQHQVVAEVAAVARVPRGGVGCVPEPVVVVLHRHDRVAAGAGGAGSRPSAADAVSIRSTTSWTAWGPWAGSVRSRRWSSRRRVSVGRRWSAVVMVELLERRARTWRVPWWVVRRPPADRGSSRSASLPPPGRPGGTRSDDA